jgi:hypothetical protein
MDSPQSELAAVVSQFRVLNSWTVTYDPTVMYKNGCEWNKETKRAAIYGWGGIGPQPKDYLLHEVLHIAFHAATADDKALEEMFVRDLCRIIHPTV